MKIVCHIFSAFTKQILPNKTFVYEKKSCQHTHLIEVVSNWPLGRLRLFQDYAGSSWPSWIEGEPCRRQPPFCSKRFYQYRLSPSGTPPSADGLTGGGAASLEDLSSSHHQGPAEEKQGPDCQLEIQQPKRVSRGRQLHHLLGLHWHLDEIQG